MKLTKTSILFFVVICFTTAVRAQFSIITGNAAAKMLNGSDLVRYDEARQVPVYAEFNQENPPTKEELFRLFQEQLNMSSEIEFKLVASKKDLLGYTHDKYAQFYRGVEYAYINLTIHSKNDKIVSFSGNFSPLLPIVHSISVDLSVAFQKCLDLINAEEYYDNVSSKNQSEIVYLRTVNQKDEIEIKKCYRFNIYAKSPLSRGMYYVNVVNGEIEFQENLIHTGSSEGKTITAYSDTQDIRTDSLTSSFRLVDTTRGNGVETYNCQKTKNYASAVDFTDADNFWNNVNNNLDQYATDAHWGTEKMYDYLAAEHNYNSIDDSGFTLKSYIHYDVNYVNAFWDGQRVTFGDGDQNNDPLVSLDIVGHEITHGLTEFSAGLIYAKESGALNESFSDIFGTSLEFFVRPNEANWTVGEDIGGAFRSMSNPKQYNNPDTYNGQFWIDQNCIPTKANDKCGVHTNSGVQNRWFYILVKGDTGVNDMADTFRVSGIGINKAAAISFRSLTQYLSPSSNYSDARFYSIIAAVDLYGACSPEVEAVTNAWYAVGVGNGYVNQVIADFTAVLDTNYCSSSATIKFESTGSNVVDFKWDFGNGDTSNLRNPTAFYANQGKYDVNLIADGGTCGSDTVFKAGYIDIDTNIACAYFFNGSSTQKVTNCRGRIMDSGGINEDYKVDENGVITIEVPNSDFIELSFIDLSVISGDGFSCNRDYLEVYDGDSITSPSLGRFCKNNLPIGNLIRSSTNILTIRFHSDDLVSDSGFLLSWECKSASQLPLVDFEYDVDSSCTGIVHFKNKTQNGANKLKWNFGDGNYSTQQNPKHEYKSNRTYTVKLIGENSIGIDSISKNSIVSINRPQSPNASMDTFCFGENAGIKVYSTEIVEWYRDTTANSVFTGDSVSFFKLKADTILYYRELTKEVKFTGGPLQNTIGAGGFSNENDYIEFDVHEAIQINKILFYSDHAGIRTLDIRNNKGEIVHTKELYIPSIGLFATINLVLQPDTNYRISISSRNTGLYKNTAGANFPYPISNLVTLKRSNAASGEYPFFYRWSISKLSCVSNFKKATAIVDTSCVVTGVNEAIDLAQLKVYPNPVLNKLIIENEGVANFKNVELKLYSATGQLIYSKLNNNNLRIIQINLESFPSGVYYLKIRRDGELRTSKIVKLD